MQTDFPQFVDPGDHQVLTAPRLLRCDGQMRIWRRSAQLSGIANDRLSLLRISFQQRFKRSHRIRWCATCSSALRSNGFTKTKHITFCIEKYRERSPPHVLGRLLKRHAARRHRFILFLNVLALKYH